MTELTATLQRLAAEGGGSSQRVERLLVLREPAQLDAGEITDKGYINQAAVLLTAAPTSSLCSPPTRRRPRSSCGRRAEPSAARQDDHQRATSARKRRTSSEPIRQGRRRHREWPGLGLAYAIALARHGASVVINDVDAAVGRFRGQVITDAGGVAVAEVVPVGPSEAAQALVDRAVDMFGRLDVLVNNAGIPARRHAVEYDRRAVRRGRHHRHLRGTSTSTRAAATRMRGQGEGGRIICVGPRTGQLGNLRPGQRRGGKGRHRRDGAYVAAGGAGWCAGHHRLRHRPGRGNRDDRDHPVPQALCRGSACGRAAPVVRPSRAGFRVTARRRWAGRLPGLGRRRQASAGRRSASAATGWRCGRTRARPSSRSPRAAGGRPTPSPRPGPSSSRPAQQRVGQQFPEPPQ